jgi:signal transduction histidine kinase
LAFRGETLGVLAAVDRADGKSFDDADEQLLRSVAASAATAVATARSVADARLRSTVEAADQARARWARELHDETLQGLTGARMVLSAGLAHGGHDGLREAAATADSHLGEETRKLRDLIAELRPAALDDLGLGPAIESLATRQAAVGDLTVDVKLDLGAQDRLDRDAETAIYRIVQEALTNVVKHAHAKRVALCVDQLGDRVEVAVEDDGCGFDPAQPAQGFGLTSMQERALLLGGNLSVSSADGGPTRVSAVLPVG